MKILHILDHSLPLHSGYTFRSQNIFRAQKKMGFDPVILTSPKHEESWKQTTQNFEEIKGFRYYRSGYHKSISFPMVGELSLMKRLEGRMMEVCRLEHPDLIHAHSPVLNALPAVRVAGKLGLPLVYEIRAFWEDAAVDHGTYKENSWKYRLTRGMESWSCRRVDHVVTICNALKNDLRSRGIPSEKIDVVFNGINPDDFKAVPPDNDFSNCWHLDGKQIIGFIGSFYRYEGLDLLVRAFASLAKTNQEVVLLLVGGGEMDREIRDLVAEFGLQERVIMPGRVPHEKVPGIYALIDVLAYPRISMRLTELVTPLKPLEAMAMGKVLVASDVGGHHELIQDQKTGLIFKSGSRKALTQAMKRALSDRALQTALQNKGESWVRNHHSWEKTTAVYGEIYSRLASDTYSEQQSFLRKR